MNSGKKIRLGIISALHEEQEGLVERMQGTATVTHGMRHYTTGNLFGIDAVCVLSRIGKVAAAMTASILIERFGVTHIVFTGVAGGAQSQIKVGDIVIGDSLVQYDMDASPLFPRFQVPLTGLSHFESDRHLSDCLAIASAGFLEDEAKNLFSKEEQEEFHLGGMAMHRGLIGSGDQFVSSSEQLQRYSSALPDLLAVEMEGAAVAQVCFELGIPYAVVRTISDNANEHAAHDFVRFVKTVAARVAFHIVRRLCAGLDLQFSNESAGT